MGADCENIQLHFCRLEKKRKYNHSDSIPQSVRKKEKQYISSMAAPSPILTVTELTRKIKQILEGGFSSVALQGELSNVKVHTSGHMYFSLKDEGAQISGVMWRSRVPSLTFAPEDGTKVVVTGRVTVYEPRGQYQIDASSMRPLGVGELQVAFEKLKQKLAAEGLFDSARKKPLPEFPMRIGLVTSETGAAYHDMLTVFRRRFPALTVVLRPARVQGTGAAEDIARAIGEFNELGGLDVLIVGRGGGSLEDLWAFNEEIVARAIAKSRIPVISAVGHEVDFTIADFVADLRAPTPTAAAELAVPDRRRLLEVLGESFYTMRAHVASLIEDHRLHVRSLLGSYAFNRPVDLLRQSSQRFDEATRTLISTTDHRHALARARVIALQQRFASLDPRLVLKRGYAIVSRDGRFVDGRAMLRSGDVIDVEFHDGSVRSRVIDKE
jgi:exodeoxyribonuclease VII large subunit